MQMNRIRIPLSIKICGTVNKVKYEDRLRDSGDNTSGASSHYGSTIWIDKVASRQVQEGTLIHEIIETINSGFHLQLSHQTITTLAEVLYQVLIENNLVERVKTLDNEE